MSVVTQRLITAEEFMQLPDPPDGSRQELVRGVIVTMPPPKPPHGACCSRIARRLGMLVEERKLGEVFSNDTGFISARNPDSVRGPDLAFWSLERMPRVPTTYADVPPDLAVEVVSPDDHFSRIQSKVRHYLAIGVQIVWVVDP